MIYCKRGSIWYEVDNENVWEVNDYISRDAYVLVYQRRIWNWIKIFMVYFFFVNLLLYIIISVK